MASPQFNRSIADQLGITPSTSFGYSLLMDLFRLLESRFKPLEEQSASAEQAVIELRTLVLSRVNDILLPAIQQVYAMSERGFLVARSSSSQTLGQGNILTFSIADPVERDLFTPAPFVALTRAATPDDYGIARTISYDRQHGDYLCEVVSFAGSPGPHGDWVIGALAGSTIAGLAALGDTVVAREAAVAAASAAVPAAATATSKAAIASANADAAAASAMAAAQIATYFEQLEGVDLAGLATAITEAQGVLADVQEQIETWLSGGVPAASVTESATRVFVTPAQRSEIGQLRDDIGTMSLALDVAFAARQTRSEKNQPNGYAGLGGDGLIPDALLPPTGALVVGAIAFSRGGPPTATGVWRKCDGAAYLKSAYPAAAALLEGAPRITQPTTLALSPAPPSAFSGLNAVHRLDSGVVGFSNTNNANIYWFDRNTYLGTTAHGLGAVANVGIDVGDDYLYIIAANNIARRPKSGAYNDAWSLLGWGPTSLSQVFLRKPAGQNYYFIGSGAGDVRRTLNMTTSATTVLTPSAGNENLILNVVRLKTGALAAMSADGLRLSTNGGSTWGAKITFVTMLANAGESWSYADLANYRNGVDGLGRCWIDIDGRLFLMLRTSSSSNTYSLRYTDDGSNMRTPPEPYFGANVSTTSSPPYSIFERVWGRLLMRWSSTLPADFSDAKYLMFDPQTFQPMPAMEGAGLPINRYIKGHLSNGWFENDETGEILQYERYNAGMKVMAQPYDWQTQFVVPIIEDVDQASAYIKVAA